MPRVCSICVHPEREAINKALVDGMVYRTIAQRFAASPDAVLRHKTEHLPAIMVKSKEAQEEALADDLFAQLKQLRNKAISILLKAESAGDLQTSLLGIRESRACIVLLAEM